MFSESDRIAKYKEALNPAQWEAVQHINSHLWILAGAGSGKTRVLTYKIAYLLDIHDIKPWNIMAVTFTNKAANEMKERAARLISERQVKKVWFGTFHAICGRLLRIEGEHHCCGSNYIIWDEDDKKKAISRIIKDISLKKVQQRSVINEISNAKISMISPGEYLSFSSGYLAEEYAKIYLKYEEYKEKNKAYDFDDLLCKTYEMLNCNPELREKYQINFRYILVDEYQDTNFIQYKLLKALSGDSTYVNVVGDDDQSIYGWRGADIKNILSFDKDYRDAKIIRLEQNYRSTGNILNAANCVVKFNKFRQSKTLWTTRSEGTKLKLYRAFDENEEASMVARIVLGRNDDFAILYRTNAQSRVLEDAIRRYNIPYQVIGGIKFYERKEIKDILSYLKVVYTNSSLLDLLRILNVPRRGLGEKTNEDIRSLFEKGVNPVDALDILASKSKGIKRKELQRLHELFNKWKKVAEKSDIYTLTHLIIEDTDFLNQFNKDDIEEKSRIDNVYALLDGMEDFLERSSEPTIGNYLNETSLLTDIDDLKSDRHIVTLMTLHNAKGLEFPNVCIVGVEDGLLPLGSFTDRDEEEERRLFYVGITRAKNEVYLFYARMRRIMGQRINTYPSPFLKHIEPEFIEVIK